MMLTCGDTFCRRCIEDLTDAYGTLVCPICGEVMDEDSEFSVNRLVLSLIAKNSESGIADTNTTRRESTAVVSKVPE